MKLGELLEGRVGCELYRGAVRPPFIEAEARSIWCKSIGSYRGAVRPPFIEASVLSVALGAVMRLSGGSPPPLH